MITSTYRTKGALANQQIRDAADRLAALVNQSLSQPRQLFNPETAQELAALAATLQHATDVVSAAASGLADLSFMEQAS